MCAHIFSFFFDSSVFFSFIPYSFSLHTHHRAVATRYYDGTASYFLKGQEDFWLIRWTTVPSSGRDVLYRSVTLSPVLSPCFSDRLARESKPFQENCSYAGTVVVARWVLFFIIFPFLLLSRKTAQTRVLLNFCEPLCPVSFPGPVHVVCVCVCVCG